LSRTLTAFRCFCKTLLFELYALRCFVKTLLFELNALRCFVKTLVFELNAFRCFCKTLLFELYALRCFCKTIVFELNALKCFGQTLVFEPNPRHGLMKEGVFLKKTFHAFATLWCKKSHKLQVLTCACGLCNNRNVLYMCVLPPPIKGELYEH